MAVSANGQDVRLRAIPRKYSLPKGDASAYAKKSRMPRLAPAEDEEALETRDDPPRPNLEAMRMALIRRASRRTNSTD